MRVLLLITIFAVVDLWALPFNDDMVENQISVGQSSRLQPAGSIPKGSLKYRVKTKEEAEALSNPVKADRFSVKRGKRLFAVNCSPCHGKTEGDEYAPGVAGKYLAAPNLADPFYHRKDSQIYRVIHFGNAIMPAVGWKLSQQETWDIVNYVRSIQSKEGK